LKNQLSYVKITVLPTYISIPQRGDALLSHSCGQKWAAVLPQLRPLGCWYMWVARFGCPFFVLGISRNLFIFKFYKLMRKAILSIVLASSLTLTLSGCSSNTADNSFNKKQDCAARLSQFQKSIEQYDLTPNYLIATNDVAVFYSEKLNTCVGSYIVKTTYDKVDASYKQTADDKDLGFTPDVLTVNKEQYVIKDLLTNIDIYNQIFTDTTINATSTNATVNVQKAEFIKKINELK
jgi:hypothetical protein